MPTFQLSFLKTIIVLIVLQSGVLMGQAWKLDASFAPDVRKTLSPGDAGALVEDFQGRTYAFGTWYSRSVGVFDGGTVEKAAPYVFRLGLDGALDPSFTLQTDAKVLSFDTIEPLRNGGFVAIQREEVAANDRRCAVYGDDGAFVGYLNASDDNLIADVCALDNGNFLVVYQSRLTCLVSLFDSKGILIKKCGSFSTTGYLSATAIPGGRAWVRNFIYGSEFFVTATGDVPSGSTGPGSILKPLLPYVLVEVLPRSDGSVLGTFQNSEGKQKFAVLSTNLDSRVDLDLELAESESVSAKGCANDGSLLFLVQTSVSAAKSSSYVLHLDASGKRLSRSNLPVVPSRGVFSGDGTLVVEVADYLETKRYDVLVFDSQGKLVRDFGADVPEMKDVKLASVTNAGRIWIEVGDALYSPPSAGQTSSFYSINPMVHYYVDGVGDKLRRPVVSLEANLDDADRKVCSEMKADQLGRILLNGDFSVVNGIPCKGLVRFLPSGVLDIGFTAEIPDSVLSLNSITFFADGSLVCTGQGVTAVGEDGHRYVRPIVLSLDSRGRFLRLVFSDAEYRSLGITDGEGRVLVGAGWLDPLDGKVQAFDASVTSDVILLNDGRLVFSNAVTGYYAVPKLYMINRDGRLDNTFAPSLGHRSLVKLLGQDTDGRLRILVKDNEAIFGGGNAERPAYQMRLTLDGTLDIAFTPVPVTDSDHAVTADWLPDRSFAEAYSSATGGAITGKYVMVGDGSYFVSAPFSRWTRGADQQLEIFIENSTVAPGSDVLLEAKTNIADLVTYQWIKNGVILDQGAHSFLALRAVQASQAGRYELVVQRKDGQQMKASATLTIIGDKTKFWGFSSRGLVTPTSALISGIVVDCPSPGTLLVRSLGRALQSFSIGTEVLGDNSLTANKYSSDVPGGVLRLALDEGGIVSSGVSTLSVSLGLAPVAATTPDSNLGSAVILGVDSGAYTFVSQSEHGASGVCLSEMYLADSPGAALGSVRACSSRGLSGNGSQVLISGFAIAGVAPVRMLIRGVGPSMRTSGVSNAIADPTLTLCGTTGALTNDDWAGDPEVAAAMKKLGMAAWDPKSKESAILVTLAPGAYTVLLRNMDELIGDGLIEAYIVE